MGGPPPLPVVWENERVHVARAGAKSAVSVTGTFFPRFFVSKIHFRKMRFGISPFRAFCFRAHCCNFAAQF
jgi:hypothetical protein